MKKNVILYSSALPMFLLLLRPIKWIYLLPINLLILALALYLSLSVIGKPDAFRPLLKKQLWLSWLFGFIGDLASAGILFGLFSIPGSAGSTWALTMDAIARNPFLSTNSLVIVFLAIIVSAALKYVLNLWLAFRKSDLGMKDKRMLCLCLAMFTAPYTLLLPASLLSFLS